jgi:transmembrane sensor
MTELDPKLRDALTQIRDAWSVDRTERTLVGTRLRQQRTQRRRRTLGGAAGILVVMAAVLAAWQRTPTPHQLPTPSVSSPQPLAAVADRHMQFEDGSQLELLDPSTRVVVDEVVRQRVSVRLLSGRVRVDVVPRKERAFRVECGLISVEVLGTAFELRREGERTHVSVLRGRVAVHAPEGSVQLVADEAGWFPRNPEEGARSRPQRRAAKLSAAEATWQAQAKRGDYTRAYELMPSGPDAVADDVESLLLAADAARLSGHPAQAVPFLRQITERHAKDPRASLAAFTLGGVLLNQLDRPREADAAYARARSLSLSTTLAQDALARQVEAAKRVGDPTRVRELANEYLRRYPDGRRVQWVREASGL